MTVLDVWLTPVPAKTSRLWALSSNVVILLVTVCSKWWLGVLNKPTVYDRQRLYDAIDHRPPGKPLITVCNHPSTIDDTLLCYMLRWSDVFNRPSLRWLLGAKDICFRNRKSCVFFQLGRVLPVKRGDGVYQHGMDFCVDRLGEGGWVHVYPEGKINREKELIRLKWGVGRLIADSSVCPIVLPYWHIGMDDVLPVRRPYIPRTGKRITVVFGHPMNFENDLELMRAQNKSDEEVRKYITDKVQEEFARLKEETEQKHKEEETETDQHSRKVFS